MPSSSGFADSRNGKKRNVSLYVSTGGDCAVRCCTKKRVKHDSDVLTNSEITAFRQAQIRPPSAVCRGIFPTWLICGLPDDILSRILFGGYLDPHCCNLANVIYVCSRLRNLALTSVSVLNGHGGFCRDARHNYITTRTLLQFRCLKEINLSFCSSFNDQHMEMMIPLREKLSVLKLRGTMVSDLGVIIFFSKGRLEDTTYLGQQAATTKSRPEVESRLILRLEVLDLSNIAAAGKARITDQSLAAIVRSCPNLTVLHLAWYSGITDESMFYIPYLKKLHTLDLSLCSITAQGCRELSDSATLRILDISGCPNLDGKAINALLTGCFLSSASTSRANSVDTDTSPRPPCSARQRFDSSKKRDDPSCLRVLAARFSAKIDLCLPDTVFNHAPNLKFLDLRYYLDNGSDEDLLDLTKRVVRRLRKNGTKVAFSKFSKLS